MSVNSVKSQENFATNRFILVEISTLNKTLNRGNQIKFRDTPELRHQNGLILTNGLQFFSATQLAVAPSGQAVIPEAEIINAVLVLAVIQKGKDTNERIVRVPLYDLVASLNGGYIRTLANLPIIVNKSYVEILNPAITADVSFIFGFHYWNSGLSRDQWPPKRRK